MTGGRITEIGRRMARQHPREFRMMGMAFVAGGKWIVEEAVKAEMQARAKATAAQFARDLAQLNAAALITPDQAGEMARGLHALAGGLAEPPAGSRGAGTVSGERRPKVIVYHAFYGCDTGCCGHVVELGGTERFDFMHPFGQDPRVFAEELVTDKFGAEHVADLDWDNCVVIDC